MNKGGGVLAPETPAEQGVPIPTLDRTVEVSEGNATPRHGTFQLVFGPAVLTMLCVVMFLREGWIVGHAGVLGAALVIVPAFFIMATSALMLSTICTNAREGGGGLIGIIMRSLGFETGGSIGLPLFLGHVLLIVLFVYAFAEAWQLIFPLHPQMAVAYGVFAALLAGRLLPRRLVSRLQDASLLLVAAAVGSALLGGMVAGDFGGLREPHLWGSFDGAGYWLLFAIFFAAGGGIGLSASMPEGLPDPRRSIPRGMLAAIGVAFGVYLIMAIWYGSAATPTVLIANYAVIVERAAWGPIVVGAILAATFTAALIALIETPKMLQALIEQGVIGRGRAPAWSSSLKAARLSVYVTSALVVAAMLLGGLDLAAVCVTLAFLMSYLAIHAAVIAEQEFSVFSFRPALRVPRWLAPLGALACFSAMFVISPIFAIVGLALTIAVFVYLARRPVGEPDATVRSGIVNVLAEKIWRETEGDLADESERSWKPNILVPVMSRSHLDGTYRFLRLLTEPNGSIRILGIHPPSTSGGGSRGSVLGMADRDLFGSSASSEAPFDGDAESKPGGSIDNNGSASEDLGSLTDTTEVIRNDALRAAAVVIEAPNLVKGVVTATTIYRSSAFPPNIVFGFAHLYNQEKMQGLVDAAQDSKMGVALFHLHPEVGLGHERIVNVWIDDRSPDWRVGLRMDGLDLMILLACQITRNMGGRLRLSTVYKQRDDATNAGRFLDRLVRDARLPDESDRWTAQGSLLEQISNAPQADLHLFALSQEVHHARITTLVRHTGSSCLFVRGSGRESALA